MKLKNMKLDKTEKEEYAGPVPSADAPAYPYGLRISLQEDSLKKLGVTQLPAVGEHLMLYARVEVCTTSEYASQDGRNHTSVDLQITDMSVIPEMETEAASALYGEKKK